MSSARGPVFLDVAKRHQVLFAWLDARGFQRQRPFARMALGEAPTLAGTGQQFVLAGPEFG